MNKNPKSYLKKCKIFLLIIYWKGLLKIVFSCNLNKIGLFLIKLNTKKARKITEK